MSLTFYLLPFTFYFVKISVAMIVFNEEENIREVCETVSWADEIVIVDSDSTDKTAEIARKYTGKVYNREFRGYKDKHEFADAQTTGDWIFWIDADERVTPELRRSIVSAMSKICLTVFGSPAKPGISTAGSNIPAGIPIIKCGFTANQRASGTAFRRTKRRASKAKSKFWTANCCITPKEI